MNTLMYSGMGWSAGSASGGKGLLAVAHVWTLPDLRPCVTTITITAESLQQLWTAELRPHCYNISQILPHAALLHAFFQLHGIVYVPGNVLLCERAGGSQLATVVDNYIARDVPLPVILGVKEAVRSRSARCRKGKSEWVQQPAWYSMKLSSKTSVEPTCKLISFVQCSLCVSKEAGISNVEAGCPGLVLETLDLLVVVLSAHVCHSPALDIESWHMLDRVCRHYEWDTRKFLRKSCSMVRQIFSTKGCHCNMPDHFDSP